MQTTHAAAPALQLFAMRFGTVPVAHATGGLIDTIEDFHAFAPPGMGVLPLPLAVAALQHLGAATVGVPCHSLTAFAPLGMGSFPCPLQ